MATSNAAAKPVERETRLSDAARSARGMLRRRWLTIVLVSAGAFTLAVAVVLLMAPRYEATARVQIDPNRSPLQREQANLGSEAIETQVTVLNSDELARAVVSRLKLGSDPEFTQGIDDPERGVLSAEERLHAVSRRVRKHLKVQRDRLTYIINISYSSRDPEKAAQIANAFAAAYLDAQVGSRVGTSERQAAFFKRQLQELEQQVRAADAAVAQYRASAGITEGAGSSTITDQQIAPLSTQLATAESEAAEARSNLAAARSQVARGGLDAVAAVRSSPVISDLRRQRAEVLRVKGEVDARYGEKHSETIKVREQLNGLDAQIADEAARAISSLEAAANASAARAASLRAALDRLQSDQARNTRASVTATGLERDAATKRAAYERLSQLSLESTQGVRNQIAQASIIDSAVPPLQPTDPNRKLLIALAFVGSLAAGGAAGILQEIFATGLRTTDEFEDRFGVPIIASVPRLRRVLQPADLLIEQPNSLFAETIRMATASLMGVRGADAPRIIAVTSAVPEEGKTTTALALARTIAQSGARTLLLDCDIRRAAMRELTGDKIRPGLVEVLNGEAALSEALSEDAVPGLEVVVVRQPGSSTDELFKGERFQTLLRSQDYDHVVLDLPPLLGIAQARYVAAAADAVVFVVRWSGTPVPAIDAAMKMLAADGSKQAGAIYTMVDPSAEAIGGTYYSKKYGAYYHSH